MTAWGKRGPKRYAYTIGDVARAAGLSEHTVRGAAFRLVDGERRLDLHSLESVVAFVSAKRARAR